MINTIDESKNLNIRHIQKKVYAVLAAVKIPTLNFSEF